MPTREAPSNRDTWVLRITGGENIVRRCDLRKALAGAVTLANVCSGPIKRRGKHRRYREDIGNTGLDVMPNDGTGKLRGGHSNSLASRANAGSATCSTRLEGQRSLLGERTRPVFVWFYPTGPAFFGTAKSAPCRAGHDGQPCRSRSTPTVGSVRYQSVAERTRCSFLVRCLRVRSSVSALHEPDCLLPPAGIKEDILSVCQLSISLAAHRRPILTV